MKNILEIIILAFVLVLMGFLIIFYTAPQESEEPFFLDFSFNQNKEIIKGMSLDQKIGQLFIIGFEGKTITPEIGDLIKEFHPAGVLLLGRNIKDKDQLKELINALQEISLKDTGLPLFIAVDQEGGEISRIGWIDDVGQSEIENKEEAYQTGKNRGEQLKELGINLNLAPLLDAAGPNDFIYQRTFQQEPEIIKELSEAMVKGQAEAGILTGLKHFPGYGGISFNPEEKLAVLEEFPEISQFENQAEMIMTSNVIYKEIDQKIPFSFLEKGIELLRGKIKGKYLIISDDLAQNSLLNELSLEDIVVLSVKAGTDILIFSGWRIPVRDGISAFKEAVEKGEISEQRINQSVLKIIELKRNLK